MSFLSIHDSIQKILKTSLHFCRLQTLYGTVNFSPSVLELKEPSNSGRAVAFKTLSKFTFCGLPKTNLGGSVVIKHKNKNSLDCTEKAVKLRAAELGEQSHTIVLTLVSRYNEI